MNELRALALAFFCAVAACDSAPALTEAPLAGAAIGGPFALTDQDGKTVRDTDFAGRYRIVYFGYTFCPDICPTEMQGLSAGLNRFKANDPGGAAKVQPIFISVDPERDTPAALKQFVAAFPGTIGLTGTPAQIAATAKAYGVYYKKAGGASAADYLMDHSNVVLLMGPDGAPIAMLPTDKGPEAVAAELARWVR